MNPEAGIQNTGNYGSGALEEMSKKDIKELLSKGWITHDAM